MEKGKDLYSILCSFPVGTGFAPRPGGAAEVLQQPCYLEYTWWILFSQNETFTTRAQRRRIAMTSEINPSLQELAAPR